MLFPHGLKSQSTCRGRKNDFLTKEMGPFEVQVNAAPILLFFVVVFFQRNLLNNCPILMTIITGVYVYSSGYQCVQWTD